MLNVLDLFSGIGGFSLGLERAGLFRTVAFCEREPFPQAVLRKHWPEVPIYDDVRTIDTERLGRIDLICGGFPCQPWSVAGKQRGAEDDRDLWPVMASLIEKLRPRWVVGENVRGFVNEPMGLERSLSDLESFGYQTAPFVIPACAVNAPHRRDRVWIVAHAAQLQRDGGEHYGENDTPGRVQRQLGGGGRADDVAHADGEPSTFRGADKGYEEKSGRWGNQPQGSRSNDWGELGTSKNGIVAHSDSQRGRGGDASRKNAGDVGQSPRHTRQDTRGVEPWLPEPDVGRVANGVPRMVDRLKALGNAVVPQVVEQIGRAIMEAENAP